jgi:hypothetical protein
MLPHIYMYRYIITGKIMLNLPWISPTPPPPEVHWQLVIRSIYQRTLTDLHLLVKHFTTGRLVINPPINSSCEWERLAKWEIYGYPRPRVESQGGENGSYFHIFFLTRPFKKSKLQKNKRKEKKKVTNSMLVIWVLRWVHPSRHLNLNWLKCTPYTHFGTQI